MTENVVIVSAARTAVGNFGGSLAKIPAHILGARVIVGVLDPVRFSCGGRRGTPQTKGRLQVEVLLPGVALL